MKKFKDAYIEAILFAETDENGVPLDENYSRDYFSKEAIQKINNDCQQFLEKAGDLIGDRFERAGHDFWLTRNRHGAGFWDGDWEKSVGKQLTQLAHNFGECGVYLGDDDLIYLG